MKIKLLITISLAFFISQCTKHKKTKNRGLSSLSSSQEPCEESMCLQKSKLFLATPNDSILITLKNTNTSNRPYHIKLKHGVKKVPSLSKDGSPCSGIGKKSIIRQQSKCSFRVGIKRKAQYAQHQEATSYSGKPFQEGEIHLYQGDRLDYVIDDLHISPYFVDTNTCGAIERFYVYSVERGEIDGYEDKWKESTTDQYVKDCHKLKSVNAQFIDRENLFIHCLKNSTNKRVLASKKRSVSNINKILDIAQDFVVDNYCDHMKPVDKYN